MLVCYCDESHDEGEQRVFAVGGFSATESEWELFGEKWNAITEGATFHAADCEAGRGSFEGWPREKRFGLYRHLAELIATSPLLGEGCAVFLPEFYGVFPETGKASPYLFCFQDVVTEFYFLGDLVIPKEDVAFVFDRNQDYAYNATFLYDLLARRSVGGPVVRCSGDTFAPKEWPLGVKLDAIAFQSKERSPGLQAADMIARETYKFIDNLMTSNRPMRGSLKAFRKRCQLRFHQNRCLRA